MDGHHLTFFALDIVRAAQTPEEPEAAEKFIQLHGDHLGSMTFPPGASTLFFLAAEEISGQELMPLLTGPAMETDQADSVLVGGMDRPFIQAAKDALDAFLSEASENTAGLPEMAERTDVTVKQLLSWLVQLRDLFEASLQREALLVTLYR